eukprot:XP_006504962.1 PREDICTED: uncharacterized protein Gm15411 [Mus musculus]
MGEIRVKFWKEEGEEVGCGRSNRRERATCVAASCGAEPAQACSLESHATLFLHNSLRALLPALLALQLRVTWQLLHQGSMNDRLLPAPKMLPGSSFLVVDAELETGRLSHWSIYLHAAVSTFPQVHSESPDVATEVKEKPSASSGLLAPQISCISSHLTCPRDLA